MSIQPAPRSIDLGGCTVTLIDGGRLKLDGGAMFGIIPKALWSKRVPADDENRIQLACNCLLVEWQHETACRVIIETGHGPKFAEKDQRIFAIDPSRWLLPSLSAAGVDAATITDVIVSHLHFDHAGGLTRTREGAADRSQESGVRSQESEGAQSGIRTPQSAIHTQSAIRNPQSAITPTFPNARVHVQRREFDDARANFGIMKFTYREDNFQPIDAADAWNLLDGDGGILPGIRAIATPGHTRGHQSILIEGRDRSALFVGDVMPLRHHVGRPYNMAYDVLPLDNAETKHGLLQTAAEREWLLIIDHEVETPVVQAVVEGDWFTLRAVETES